MIEWKVQTHGDVQHLKTEVSVTGGKKSQVEQVVQTRKEGLVDFDKDLDVLHAKVDNTNYFLKKNNIKTSGLKEGVERREGSGFIFGRSFFLDW